MTGDAAEWSHSAEVAGVRLVELFTTFFDDEVPVAFVAFDGSRAGPAQPVAVVELRTPEAVQYAVTAPASSASRARM